LFEISSYIPHNKNVTIVFMYTPLLWISAQTSLIKRMYDEWILCEIRVYVARH